MRGIPNKNKVKDKHFGQFIEEKFQFSFWAGCQRDGRGRKTKIPTSGLFRTLIVSMICGIGALLRMDQCLAMSVFRRKQHVPKASDTTLLRALAGWQYRPLRALLTLFYGRLREQGKSWFTLPSGKRIRVAVCDGSCFGQYWMSVLCLVTDQVLLLLDIEPYGKRGKELPASRKVLDKTEKRLGKQFITHLLYDGLMAVRSDFQRAVDHGYQLIVKTPGGQLSPVQDVEQILRANPTEKKRRTAGIEYRQGIDEKRYLAYTCSMVREIIWDGLATPLTVMKVEQTHLKGKRQGVTECFWVLTTDAELTIDDLWELVKTRWCIENNAFKELNELTHCKKKYIKHIHTKRAYVMIAFIAWFLLQAFRAFSFTRHQWPKKRTTKFLLQLMILFDELPEPCDTS